MTVPMAKFVEVISTAVILGTAATALVLNEAEMNLGGADYMRRAILWATAITAFLVVILLVNLPFRMASMRPVPAYALGTAGLSFIILAIYAGLDIANRLGRDAITYRAPLAGIGVFAGMAACWMLIYRMFSRPK